MYSWVPSFVSYQFFQQQGREGLREQKFWNSRPKTASASPGLFLLPGSWDTKQQEQWAQTKVYHSDLL